MHSSYGGFNRRDFLKLAGAGALGALAGLLGYTVWDKSAPAPQADSRYFRKLDAVIKKILAEEKLEIYREAYLGNVNDFDRGGVLVSSGSTTYMTGGEASSGFRIYTDPKTGQLSQETFRVEAEPERKEVTIHMPEYLTNNVRKKKDRIRLLYLDSGKPAPFRPSFEKSGYVVEEGMKKLLPGIDVKLEQDVIKWDPSAKIFWGFVSGGIEPDRLQDGKFSLSNGARYVLFTEVPLDIVLSDNPGTPGFAHLYRNLAVINLDQYKKGALEEVAGPILQETAHMYGVPHCWETQCAMSRAIPWPLPAEFGDRCRMIGKNIANGRIVEIKEGSPRAHFESGRVIPPSEAEKDLEKHLTRYVTDIMREPLPDGVELQATMGRKLDVARFVQDGSVRMELEIPDYIGNVRVFG